MNQGDKDLLVWAAHGIGLELKWRDCWGQEMPMRDIADGEEIYWNPLDRNDDMMGVLVQLDLSIARLHEGVDGKYARVVYEDRGEVHGVHIKVDDNDVETAIRRGVVIAASKIGMTRYVHG